MKFLIMWGLFFTGPDPSILLEEQLENIVIERNQLEREKLELLELLERILELEEILDTPTFENVNLVTDRNDLTFMHYEMVTDRTAPQYFYRINGYTGKHGMRLFDGYYQVAMGTPYAKVGDKFRITFDNGVTIPVIVADSKGDRHYHLHGSTLSQVEVLVDQRVIPQSVWSYGTFNHLVGNRIIRLERECG